MDEINLFRKALFELHNEHAKWTKNLNLFLRWDATQQEWWIGHIKQQAKKGIPVAVAVVQKVVEIRLRGANGNQP